MTDLAAISRRIALSVFLIVALHASPSGVQNHRYIASVASLVEDGSFAISPRFGVSNPDFVGFQGRRYPNMPPGVAMLLAPSYWVYSHVIAWAVPGPREMQQTIFGLWAAVTVTAPILALAAVVMFKLVQRLTQQTTAAIWLAFGLVFGTPVFYYSTGLWSHQYGMSLALAAFYLIVTRRPAWLIGALLGGLLLMEHQAPLAIALLGAFWLWSARQDGQSVGRRLGDGCSLALGLLPFLAVLLAYNHDVTGSVLRSPVALWYEQNLPGEPTFVWPTLARVFGMTFSPFRGIFLYAPLTLLSIAAVARGRAARVPMVRFSYLFTAAFFVMCVSYIQWETGATFGPRYFTTALPFALIPAAYWATPTIRTWVWLSIIINWAGATTNASSNLVSNLIIYSYRGPFPGWLFFLHRDVLPACCGIEIYAMTPFWLYAALGLALWLMWRTPRDDVRP